MTQKSTKRALLASVFSILICLSMLIGSTFAWFTDTATTGVNTIQSGNLDVDLVDDNGASVVGRKLAFKDSDNNFYWEPGCTYTLENVYVVNNGNLALEYEIVITGIDGNTGLLKVIEWTIHGTEDGILLPGAKSGAISIEGHMLETANNDYMNMTLEGISITVNAYQTPSEKDSSTEDYDKDARPAEEVKTATVVTAAQLQTMLTQFTDAGSGDGTVNIAEDIVLAEGETWTPVTVDGYSGAGVITLNGNGHSISGLNAPLFKGGFAGASGIVINNLTIKDSTLVSSHTTGAGAFIETADSMPTITLKGCKLIDSSLTSTVADCRTGGLLGWASGYAGNDGPVFTTITIEDCVVEGCEISGGSSVGGIIGHDGGNSNTLTKITNCTVKNTKINSSKASDYRVGVLIGTANGGDVVITGITNEGNTVTQATATTTKVHDLVGRFAGPVGDVTLDGVKIN